MRNTGSTALLPGWYVEFQAALLRQAPRPGEIDQVTAEGWTNNQKSLKNKLNGCLVPPLSEIIIQQLAPNPILRCVSGCVDLVIPACDGSHILANAKNVFKSYTDPNFKDWRLDKPGKPTKKIAVAVHETVEDGTFTQMLGSFGVDLDKLCFTQHQIKVFCEKYPNWLRTKGYRTFFLTKKDWDMPANLDNLFVANVLVDSDGLYVYIHRLEDDIEWSADDQHRLVVPQLAT